MKINGSVALVTGANRGLGRAYVEALLAAGAARVYAGARDPSAIGDRRVIPIKLDVTSKADVLAAAERCEDVNVLINNAGIMLDTSALAQGSDEAMRREMEVNVYGVLAMVRAFAPILAKNGGGAIANMLSVVSWFTYPFNATYCASKHAALAITNSMRIELKAQGIHVVGVYAGFIDTDMAAAVNQPKTSPRQVAEETLKGIEARKDHVRADEQAEKYWKLLREDPSRLENAMQEAWDQRGDRTGIGAGASRS
jgi:NAD(P)-dependent dehydrogenase (short-subunit alcohol dehydrogenase family)